MLAERYILANTVRPMFQALLFGMGVLLAVRLSLSLEFGLSQKGVLLTLIRTLGYWLPFYLGLTIPVALFTGLILGFEKMGKANEVASMQASGMGPFSFLRPVLLLTLLITIVATLIYGWIDPLTTYARRVFNNGIEQKIILGVIEENTFYKFGNTTVLIEILDRPVSSFQRIFIHRRLGDNSMDTITSTVGKLVQSDDNGRPVLILKDAEKLFVKHSALDNGPDASNKFQTSSSKVFSIPLGPKLKLFRKRGYDSKEWTLPELFAANYTKQAMISSQKIKAELHFRLAEIVFVSSLPFLALSFSNLLFQRRTIYRTGIGIIFMICCYQLLLGASILAATSKISPILLFWPSMILYMFLVMLRSYWVFSKPDKGY